MLNITRFRKVLIASSVLLLTASFSAHADDTSQAAGPAPAPSSAPDSQAPSSQRQVTASVATPGVDSKFSVGGIGAQYGNHRGETQGAFVLNHQGADINTNTYVRANSAFELNGKGMGLSANVQGGQNLWQGSGTHPLIGIEPLQGKFHTSVAFTDRDVTTYGVLGQPLSTHKEFQTMPGHDAYAVYNPMAALGAQIDLRSICQGGQAIAAVRGGATLSTSTRSSEDGLHPAMGVEAMAVCKNFLANLEYTRTVGQKTNIDDASATVAFRIPGQTFGIGASITSRGAGKEGDGAFSAPSMAPGASELTAGAAVVGTW